MFVLEVGARWYADETKDVYSLDNFLLRDRDLFRRDAKAVFDPEFGWIPKAGVYSYTGEDNTVTILKGGVRSNGNPDLPSDAEVMLAVGDSFTFGDDVSDDETWPSALERLSNIKVINGGVFGYGIDQVYLRMKSLATEYSPSTIIFSFIEDDIMRCELSERTGVPKPYFRLTEISQLILITDHLVTYAGKTLPMKLDALRNILGYSLLVHKLMVRAFPEYWLLGYQYISKRSYDDADGLAISCAVFKKLASYAEEEDITLYVLVQYDDDDFNPESFQYERRLNRLWTAISCIEQHNLTVIDTRAVLASIKSQDIERFNSFYNGHMTKFGNELMASILWEEISRVL